MKTLISMMLLLLPLQGVADIYKCQDSGHAVVYQDTPCAAKKLGTIKSVPAPAREDTLQAQRDLERMARNSRYFDRKQQAEWDKKQEEIRLLEARELQERELMAAQARRDEYIPLFRPVSTRHRDFPQMPPVTPAPRKQPCIIGYVGDKSCR